MKLPFHVIGALPVAGEASGAEGGNLDTGTIVVGLLVVAVVWLARSLMSLRTEVEELRESRRAGVRPVSPAAPASAAPPPEKIAAIAAAVHCVLGARARLVAIGVSDASGQQAWSREGRRQVFQSHQLR